MRRVGGGNETKSCRGLGYDPRRNWTPFSGQWGGNCRTDASWKEKKPVRGQTQIYSQLILVKVTSPYWATHSPQLTSHFLPQNSPGTALTRALVSAIEEAVGPGICRTPLTSCEQASV